MAPPVHARRIHGLASSRQTGRLAIPMPSRSKAIRPAGDVISTVEPARQASEAKKNNTAERLMAEQQVGEGAVFFIL
ncbi:MAG: hypothetical protein KatS3mg029_0788 [Saprospiraceae bacterium]|nr:MAG: hypothetical protein KatS3mg029_0788 [Saprospiraceae bacterium]